MARSGGYQTDINGLGIGRVRITFRLAKEQKALFIPPLIQYLV